MKNVCERRARIEKDRRCVGERAEMSPTRAPCNLSCHAATFHNTGIVFNILTIYMAVYMHSWSVSRYLRAVRESRVKGNLQIRCATGRQNTLNEFICSIYVNFEEFRNYFRVTLLRVTHISFRNFFEQLAKYKIRKNLKKSDTIL